MKSHFFNTATLYAAALILSLSSCTKDLYDADYKDGNIKNPLGISAPDNFKWSSLSTAQIVVTLDDKFLGKYDYLLEIYDRNPLYGNDAHLLGVGISKLGQYTTEISFPQATDRIYIKQTDPRGRISVRSFMATTNGETINCDFNSFEKEVVTRAKSENNIPEYNYTIADIPSDATEVTSDDQNPKTTNLKITGNYTGGINKLKDGKLFISGTWTISDKESKNWKYSIEGNTDIIVLPGGKIILQEEDKTLDFKQSSNLIVMESGKVECKGSLRFTNDGFLYNKGNVEISQILEMQANSSIYNFCMIKIEKTLSGDAGHLILHQDNGSIIAKNIIFNNLNALLLNGSMIKATEKIKTDGSSYYAEGKNTSLIKAPIIECISNVLYSGKMVIESDDHTQGEEWWSPYKIEKGASMAKYDQSEVVIETCEETANPGNPGGEPTNPKYPIIIDTTGDEYIFAMEDSWPSYGDYDMNDVVMKFSRNKITLYSDGSKSITFQAKVIAMGAVRPIAGAIQFDKVAASLINGVTYSNPSLVSSFKLNAQNIEEGQKQAIVPLFANAKEFCGQNASYVNVGNVNGSGIIIDETSIPAQEITIHFASVVKNEDIEIRNLNFFITTNGTQTGRTEIHLAGYEPTDLANKGLLGTYDDNSIEGTFKYLSKKNNLPWGLVIPTGKWTCPEENVNILTTFPDFKNWVISGGTENKDWFVK